MSQLAFSLAEVAAPAAGVFNSSSIYRWHVLGAWGYVNPQLLGLIGTDIPCESDDRKVGHSRDISVLTTLAAGLMNSLQNTANGQIFVSRLSVQGLKSSQLHRALPIFS